MENSHLSSQLTGAFTAVACYACGPGGGAFLSSKYKRNDLAPFIESRILFIVSDTIYRGNSVQVNCFFCVQICGLNVIIPLLHHALRFFNTILPFFAPSIYTIFSY